MPRTESYLQVCCLLGNNNKNKIDPSNSNNHLSNDKNYEDTHNEITAGISTGFNTMNWNI